MQEVTEALKRMSIDELRTLCKRLGLSGYSSLRKSDLIELIAGADPSRLRGYLFPTWWEKHHNHVYGVVSVLGVVLSIAFFAWPTGDDGAPAELTTQNATIRTIEMPIAFADYAAMTPKEKTSLFQERVGERFVWQGYLANTIGFELDTLTGVPYETPVAIQIRPTQSPSPQLVAEIQFGELLPTDSGIELALQLDGLTIGQRIRLSGRLDGKPEAPVLKDAFLEAVYPVGE
jgi:hypothetical protein